MTKITLNDLSTISGNEQSAINLINDNNAIIETASDNTLSRDGTSPNQMLSNLDMNSFRILNCVDAINLNEPATYRQVLNLISSGTISGSSMPTISTLNIDSAGDTLHLRINANAVPPAIQTSPQSIVHFIGPDGFTSPWQFDTFFGATSFIFRRANGTGASPTTLLAGDAIMNFTARGYDGTAYSAAGTGTAIEVDATETWTTSAHGATWHFRAVQNGSTTTQDIGWWHAGLHVGPTQSDTLPLGWIEAEAGMLTSTLAGGGIAASALQIKATTGVGIGSEYIAFQVGNNGSLEGARLVQTSTNIPVLLLGSTTPQLSVGGFNYHNLQSHTTTTTPPVGLYKWTADANGAQSQFLKSRGATVGTHTIVQSGDILGSKTYAGSDGTAFRNAARIQVLVDGTPGASDMPGRIQLETTPDGSATPLERLRIDNAGNVIVNIAAIATNATDGFLYIPTCAGTPTGTPTTYTGRVPLVYDTTNNKFYIFNGTWKGGTAPGIWS